METLGCMPGIKKKDEPSMLPVRRCQGSHGWLPSAPAFTYIRTYRARSHLYVVGAQEEHSHALLSHFCCERHSLETRPSDIFTTYSVYPVSQPTQLSYSVQQSRGQCSSYNMSVLH